MVKPKSAAQTFAGELAARATALRLALERGDLEEADLATAARAARELRCRLAAVAAGL